jgi:hypothetical protein
MSVCTPPQTGLFRHKKKLTNPMIPDIHQAVDVTLMTELFALLDTFQKLHEGLECTF